MRSQIRFALAAAVAALIGFQPAFAQQPEAELKKAQEQLEKLLKELKERETKKAEAAKPPAPPAPSKPAVAWAQLQPAGGADATAALKALTASKDPKVATLAKELLEHLNKAAPQAGKAHELHLELVKPAQGGGVFEFKLAPDMLKAVPAKPGQLEFKVVPFPGGAEGAKAEPKNVERRVVVVGEGDAPKAGATERRVVVVEGKPGDGPKTVTATVVGDVVRATTTPAGTSTLKLSVDGKTAALLSADGTITIFDVASGKETMRFSGKK
ncbi:MAG: hypothetical protein U0791_26320 [Gemmataceae bacterium]